MSALNSDRDLVTLVSANGLWRADVHPVGASLVALFYDNQEIVITPYSKTFFAFAGATMAPWPNRLEDGTWTFGDKTLKHHINDELGHNSNHGLVFDREFEVLQSSRDEIVFQISLGEDAVYPFKVDITVQYLVSEDGLTQKISATNRDSQLVPIAFGSHPYLLLDDNSMVEINALQVYAKSSRYLPLAKIPIDESGFAKNGFNRASDLEVDDCFVSLTENADSRYSTRITRPSLGKTIEIWQSTEFDHLMLFAFRENSGAGRSALAVEPQTAPANALRSHDDIEWISPDSTWSATWGISIKEGLAND